MKRQHLFLGGLTVEAGRLIKCLGWKRDADDAPLRRVGVRLMMPARVEVEIDWDHVRRLADRALASKGRQAKSGPIRVKVPPEAVVQTVTETL